jgi:predicted dithiol-disulfide oxidoreductase (DUF899 family)/ketosteroid isomerase-like protein
MAVTLRSSVAGSDSQVEAGGAPKGIGRTMAMNQPGIVSRAEWLSARKALLAKEKAFTRERDALNAARRRLPMVRVDKDYVFEGRNGPARLLDLFEGRQQLIVYHFMFDPSWDAGCPSCSFLTDNIGHLAHLHARKTTLALVSRAPLRKIEAYRKRMGWAIPWYSSFGSDFNYDFHVTLDESVAPVEYNYMDKAVLLEKGEDYFTDGESHGLSVFLRDGDTVFHTYSAYARGTDLLVGTYNYLDMTALGRQEDWEEPSGRSDTPFMGWLRRHDEYDAVAGRANEEARVRELIAEWAAAVHAKDVDRVISHYDADVVSFDLAPPLQYVGREALRKSLAEWFSTFQGLIGLDVHDLSITVGGDVAFCRSLNRISGRRTNGEETDVWVRATIGCRRVGDRWLIGHEHASVPLYMDGSERAAVDLKP